MNQFNHDWHRHELRKQCRAWWHGFVDGLLCAGALLWIGEPIITGQWHLL